MVCIDGPIDGYSCGLLSDFITLFKDFSNGGLGSEWWMKL